MGNGRSLRAGGAERQPGAGTKNGRKVQQRGDSGRVDTLPLLGIVFLLIGKEPTENKGCCSLYGRRDDEEEVGLYAKGEALGTTATFPYIVRKLQMCFHHDIQ